MPQYVRSAFEAYQTGDPWGLYGGRTLQPRPGLPDPAAIDRMAEAELWFLWVDRRERIVLQAIALKPTWDYLEAKFKRSRRTIKRWEMLALEKICERLNQ